MSLRRARSRYTERDVAEPSTNIIVSNVNCFVMFHNVLRMFDDVLLVVHDVLLVVHYVLRRFMNHDVSQCFTRVS